MADSLLPSPEHLRGLLRYDPEAGKLYWHERGPEWFSGNYRHTAAVQARSWNLRHAGKEAFTPINSRGYHTGTVFGKMLLAHRVAWAIHYGIWPSHFIDHINGDRSDNRLGNLREATNSENMRNRAASTKSRSGVKGVRWCSRSGKWQARIGFNGRQKSLGHHKNLEDAASAYAQAARKYFGEFARS